MMKQKLHIIYIIYTAAVALLLSSCTSMVELATPLGISLSVDETAKLDRINANKVRIKDDYGQTVMLHRIKREQLSDEDIGRAILDSARAHGMDLKTVEPKKIAADGLKGVFIIGNGKILSGFIAEGTADGYFMDISYDNSLHDEAVTTAGSVKKK
ncbi:MAG: hypothetical protein SOZ80_08090 [Prevotella sp.]|uniref:hypothetical protein n=1 Tax=Prevotella sp. TaxID=59823 RepID=UPI002A33255D|nr:hypothetical protein [Prevotella sp.]MDD7317801.1 hypothetical protein [Prevotellaceae bacterium]MDY4020716.1 hypothetical protein [Prevotella sp.]